MQAQIFKSRIDTWLLIVLALSVCITMGAIIMIALNEPALLWVGLLTLLVEIGLPIWLILQTDYSLVDGTPLIRSVPVEGLRRSHQVHRPHAKPIVEPCALTGSLTDRLRTRQVHHGFAA